jgi:hypothetical protein
MSSLATSSGSLNTSIATARSPTAVNASTANGPLAVERDGAGGEYARVEWWPQRGAERVLVWQCQQMRPQLGFVPTMSGCCTAPIRNRRSIGSSDGCRL